MEFNLPIFYLENKEKLSDDIKNDLELIKLNNSSECGLYGDIFKSKNIYNDILINKWSEYYTNNKDFLKDSQLLYNSGNFINENYINTEEIIGILDKKKHKDKFEESYLYLSELNGYESINENKNFMLIYTLLLIISPVLSLLMPVFILLIPYLLLRVNKINISLTTYINTLKIFLKKMPVGKILLEGNLKSKDVFSIIFSGGLYIFQTYQNIMQCIKLKNNVLESANELYIIKSYLLNGINNIDNLLKITKKLKTYNKFNDILIINKDKINKLVENLKYISNDKISIIQNIGIIRCEYYKLFINDEYSNALEYICKINTYMDNINSIKENIFNKKITRAIYVNTHTKLSKMYYPKIEEKIKNTIIINNNKIITGVNASGKTTLIKSILLNILLSQQIGYGYYEKGKIKLYDKLHCYLNIPDTCNRDSLFQAEARRCKSILDEIVANNKKQHFCIFDELYSGTNPTEASMAGYGYLNYLSKLKNVKFMLTTHYLDMSEKLHNNNKNKIINIHMNSYYENNKLIYTYKIKKGITKLNGGVEVLKKINYPVDIINSAINYKNIK